MNCYKSGYSAGYYWKIRKKKILSNRPYINNHITGKQLKIWREGFYDGLIKSYNLNNQTTGKMMDQQFPSKRAAEEWLKENKYKQVTLLVWSNEQGDVALIKLTENYFAIMKIEPNSPTKLVSVMTELQALQIVNDLAKEHLSCEMNYHIEEENKNLKAIDMVKNMIVRLYKEKK